MIAVAIVAALLSFVERRARYKRLAAQQLLMAKQDARVVYDLGGGHFGFSGLGPIGIARTRKAMEYENADDWPWVWVRPELEPAGPE